MLDFICNGCLARRTAKQVKIMKLKNFSNSDVQTNNLKFQSDLSCFALT